jgi:dTDP-4-amino-4,6-dideoxy-D-galactose acyltransferase
MAAAQALDGFGAADPASLPSASLVCRLGSAFGAVEAAPFETEGFGMKMGKLTALRAESATREDLLRQLLAKAAAEGYRHLSCRLPASELDLILALQTLGFRLVDGSVTFARPAEAFDVDVDSAAPIGPAEAGDLATLREIAAKAFTHSRFVSDPSLDKGQARALLGQWIENDLKGRADAVLVARENGVPVGFCACLRAAEVAVIDLIAVGERQRGKGIGDALVRATLSHYRPVCKTVQVGTQLANIGALRLYARCGFLPVATEVTLHSSPESLPSPGTSSPLC